MLVGIFGTGRNGSTLLMRLLDSSPGLWVYPLELAFLTSFGYLERPFSAYGITKTLRRLANGIQTDPSRFYANSVRNWVNAQLAELQREYLDKLVEPIKAGPEVHEAIASRVTDSIPQLMPAILGGFQSVLDSRKAPTAPLLTFKSIEVGFLERYNRRFPQMRFVHIVRHPVTTYESLKRTDMVLKRKPFWFQGGDILRLQVEDRWLAHARFIIEKLRSEPDRHYLVRYEDLTRDPEETVNGICRWLNVERPARPGTQTVLGGRMMTELPPNPSQEGIKTPTQVVSNMAEAFHYEDVLTARERGWIDFRTRAVASQLGYADAPGAVQSMSRADLLRGWLPVDQWERMNAPSGLQLTYYTVKRRFYIIGKLLTG